MEKDFVFMQFKESLDQIADLKKSLSKIDHIYEIKLEAKNHDIHHLEDQIKEKEVQIE